jgi:hypothetical protein
MAKFVPDATLDAYLAKLATATRLCVLSGQPSVFGDIAALILASVAMTAGLGNGDYTAANGDTSGRKVTVAQQAAMSITASGTANHISLDDGAALIAVTTCTSQALTSGGTVTSPAWDAELADPT